MESAVGSAEVGHGLRPGVGSALRQREAKSRVRTRPEGRAKRLSERSAGGGGVKGSRADWEGRRAESEPTQDSISTKRVVNAAVEMI